MYVNIWSKQTIEMSLRSSSKMWWEKSYLKLLPSHFIVWHNSESEYFDMEDMSSGFLPQVPTLQFPLCFSWGTFKNNHLEPWPGGSDGWSIVPAPKVCHVDLWSGSQWKALFLSHISLSLSSYISKISINISLVE